MRISVRLWQTALFMTVIVVAMLILSTFLLSGIEQSIREIGEVEQRKDASALADALSPHFPITVESLIDIRVEVDGFHHIFQDDVWVFDRGGRLVESQVTRDMPPDLLEEARLEGLADAPGFAEVILEEPGLAVAAEVVIDSEGRRAGVVVVAEPTDDAEAVLDAARSNLKVAFFIATVVAGLVGVLFSEIISRRVNILKEAASAIADGDFGQRVPKGFVPDEIRDLADVYNRMAVQLGEAFAAIREHEQEIEAVVESMAEGVVALDAERTVRIANPVAAKILRTEAADLVGRVVDEVILHEDLLSLVDRSLAGKHVAATVTLGQSVLQVHCTPIGVGARPEGAVLLLRDVTEQKRWEQAQRDFIANASHEMRTPISAMKGFLELLEGGAKEAPDIRDDFLHTMQVEVERLSRLVDDLFVLAQFDAGRMQFEMAPESFRAMVEDVLAVMRPIVDDAGVALETDLDPGRLCVLCDKDRIVQVLIGFVDNAVKHSSETDTVTIAARVEGTRVVIEVSDTGSGIPKSALPKILDRFFRAKPKTKDDRARHGAGLGLAIAKEIVEAHGSEIAVKSRPGAGAVFRFDLECASDCTV